MSEQEHEHGFSKIAKWCNVVTAGKIGEDVESDSPVTLLASHQSQVSQSVMRS